MANSLKTEPSTPRDPIAAPTISGAYISEKLLKECLHACLACQLASVLCAELALGQPRNDHERRRTALSLECAGACAQAARTLLHGVLANNLKTIRQHLQTCASACASSAAECSECGDACRKCESICRLVVAAIDGTGFENSDQPLLDGTSGGRIV